MPRRIPTREAFTIRGEKEPYRFINFKHDPIMIIELNDKGNWANFQYDGVSCMPGKVRGFVFKSFKSKLKVFNSKWWYKLTRWGSEYGKRLYFHDWNNKEDKLDIVIETNVGFEKIDWNEHFKRMDIRHNKLAEEHGIYAKNILKKILREVRFKTKIDFQFAYEDTDYDKFWWEALVPLKYKGKDYFLVWNNCD